MSHDVRRREARLRAVVRAQRRFIEMLAHDVRSPVSAALLRTQALALRADAQTRPVLGALEDLLQDLSRSVGTLVDGMRILSRSPRLDRMPVDPRDAVVRALASAQRGAEHRRIRLTQRIDVDPPTILADPDRLDALVAWMAAVCVRVTRTGGAAVVALDGDADGVVFRAASSDSIADADALRHARRAFLRGGTEESDVAVGFGAAVAARLAALHGGRLTIEDDGHAPVRRLTMVARLPRAVEPRATGAHLGGVGAPAPEHRRPS
jgi:two-component system sensor histidine kinase GlrK